MSFRSYDPGRAYESWARRMFSGLRDNPLRDHHNRVATRIRAEQNLGRFNMTNRGVMTRVWAKRSPTHRRIACGKSLSELGPQGRHRLARLIIGPQHSGLRAGHGQPLCLVNWLRRQ